MLPEFIHSLNKYLLRVASGPALCIRSVRDIQPWTEETRSSSGDGKIRSTEYQQYQNIIISDGAHLYEVNEEKEVRALRYKI